MRLFVTYGWQTGHRHIGLDWVPCIVLNRHWAWQEQGGDNANRRPVEPRHLVFALDDAPNQMPIRDITSKWTTSRLATVSENIISHSAVLKQKLFVEEHSEFVCYAGVRTMVKASALSSDKINFYFFLRSLFEGSIPTNFWRGFRIWPSFFLKLSRIKFCTNYFAPYSNHDFVVRS